MAPGARRAVSAGALPRGRSRDAPYCTHKPDGMHRCAAIATEGHRSAENVSRNILCIGVQGTGDRNNLYRGRSNISARSTVVRVSSA